MNVYILICENSLSRTYYKYKRARAFVDDTRLRFDVAE